MNRVPRRRRTLVALLLAIAVLPQVAAPAAADARDGRRWPGSSITYFDATKDKVAVARAVAAWNGSGIRVRFRKTTSRARAQVVIRNTRQVPQGCGTGLAQLGYVRGHQAFVNILHGGVADGQACAWPGQTFVVAHELGHILGLDHDDSGCALMNSSHTNGMAPSSCFTSVVAAGDYRAQWRCRIIEPRDLSRAIRKYGGRARGVRKNPWCHLADRIGAPALVVAADTLDPQYVSITVTRPTAPIVPPWLAVKGDYESFEAYATPDTCPTSRPTPGGDVKPVLSYAWSVAAGEDETMVVPSPGAGNWCWSVWAIDDYGRPSAVPSTYTLTLPEAAPAMRSRRAIVAGSTSAPTVPAPAVFDLADDIA